MNKLIGAAILLVGVAITGMLIYEENTEEVNMVDYTLNNLENMDIIDADHNPIVK